MLKLIRLWFTGWLLSQVTLIITITPVAALPVLVAQTITPAIDGTNTTVTSPNSNQFDITGGTQTGNNLFHSFDRFGLTQQQIANFLSHPNIQTILSRVVGGNASVIDGLIRVTGSNANLFLMNPAGIIFGSNARLDVPGSFTATTANRIGLGQDQWFNALGQNTYTNLIGTPQSFAFITSSPGVILNAGNLAVGQGQSLTLLGGIVINTGTLSAPGGNITIAAVPGQRLVRISQAGSLLSLDLPLADSPLDTMPTPLSLPELLTGGNIAPATGVVLDNGVVRLTRSGSTIPSQAGTTIVSGEISVATTAAGTPGLITVLGDRIGVWSATLDASGQNGGNLWIGGDYQGQGTLPTAQFTLIDANSILRADSNSAIGNGGRVIVWADQTTRFQGTISARGGIAGGNGGFVETSGQAILEAIGQVDASAPAGIPGQWLLDPNNIRITDLTGSDSNITAGPDFTTTGNNAIVTPASIEAALNAGTSVSIRTGTAAPNTQVGNIFVDSAITKTAGGDASLTLDGTNSIFINANITSTSGALDVLLRPDRDADLPSGGGGGAIAITNASIFSNGGNIILGSPTNPGRGAATDINGVRLTNATLNAGGGDIQIYGGGLTDGLNGRNGIRIEAGSQVTTSGTGNLLLNGRGGSAGASNYGISITGTGTRLQTDAGQISLLGHDFNLQGNPGGGTNFQHGIGIEAGAVIQSNTGTIALTGTGQTVGSNGASNYGILVTGTGTQIISQSGEVNLIGRGGTGTNFQVGIRVAAGALIESIAGNVTLDGSGGTGISRNYGIWLQGANTQVRTQTGNIAITGVGSGTGTDNHGINLTAGAAISSTTGAIGLVGTSSALGTNNNVGIHLTDAGTRLTSQSGGISLNGTGQGTGNQNTGVRLTTNSAIQSSTGTISINGISQGSGNDNDGVQLTSGSRVETAGNGAVQVTGVGSSNGADSQGILITGTATQIRSQNSDILLNGSSRSPATPSSYGVAVTSGGRVDAAAGRGKITLEGRTAGATPLYLNQGTIAGGTGTVTLSGDGISLFGTTQLSGTGTLRLQPLTPSLNLILGNIPSGDASPGINLQAAELNTLVNGFSQILVGHEEGSGTITVTSPITFRDPVTLRSPYGAIAINALLQGIDNSSITLDAPTSLNSRGGITTANQPITFKAPVTTNATGLTLRANSAAITFEDDLAIGANTLTLFGNLILHPETTLSLNLNGIQPEQYGHIVVNSTVQLNQATLAPSLGYAPQVGDSFTLINKVTPESITGIFRELPEQAIQLLNDRPFRISYQAGNGNDVVLQAIEPTLTPPTVISPSHPPTVIPPASIPTSPQFSQRSTPEIQTTDFTPVRSSSDVPPMSEGDLIVSPLEAQFTQEYRQHLGLSEVKVKTLEDAQKSLQEMERRGLKAAIIYAVFVPPVITAAPDSRSTLTTDSATLLRSQEPDQRDRLDLILITANDKPIRKSSNATRSEVLPVVRTTFNEIADPRKTETTSYLAPTQQLYRWLLSPLEAELQKRDIHHLVYVMDVGLRTTPLAALHDGQGFAVERYSFSLVPSLSLTDTNYFNLQNSPILAMGASQFNEQVPLPAVPTELALITDTWQQGKSFLNEQFTLKNLQSQRRVTPFGIIHLATHAEFLPGNLANSYIQFWDNKLSISQLRQLGWDTPPLNLLVLSACNTAVGDREAELGFAGITVQAGVRATLASLWYISDEGTAALMTEFYQNLRKQPFKSQALRQAQLAMLKGNVRSQNGQLETSDRIFSLPPELTQQGNLQFSHPYYWAAFTMIGNPW